MKNNTKLLSKTIWYNINEKGYINKSLKNQAAIYIYMKKSGDKVSYYVGSSIRLPSRMSSHRSAVISRSRNKGNCKNGSPKFYNSVLKYSWNNFKFGILEYIDLSNITNIEEKKKTLLLREQYYLDKINPSLNTCKIANSPLGVKRNVMFSVNLSKARRGKNYNKTAKLIKANNKIITNETILKLSARYAGIKVKIYDKHNNLVKEFPTIASTAKYIGVSRTTITRILNTGISYDDYIYKFEIAIAYPIKVVNKENDSVKIYYSINAAAKCICVSRETISKYINTDKLLKNTYLITRNNI